MIKQTENWQFFYAHMVDFANSVTYVTGGNVRTYTRILKYIQRIAL